MTIPLRPRVADPVLLVMMEISRRPEKAFAQFSRDIERVCRLRRQAHTAIKSLRRAIGLAKDSLADCRQQVDWLDGLAKDGVSVNDVLTCVQEFMDVPESDLLAKLIDTIDPALLAFVRREEPYACPLCGDRDE